MHDMDTFFAVANAVWRCFQFFICTALLGGGFWKLLKKYDLI